MKASLLGRRKTQLHVVAPQLVILNDYPSNCGDVCFDMDWYSNNVTVNYCTIRPGALPRRNGC